MKQPVFRWEALRQISKVSRVALASLLRSRDPSLEQAAQSLFPEDIPVGVSKGSGLNLAGPNVCHPLEDIIIALVDGLEAASCRIES